MTNSPVPLRDLRTRVGDLRQFASIRLIELGDGAERGVRALAMSSGGGLDAWVLVDRSFDIGPVWHAGVPVAWQSATGFRGPFLHDGEADGGSGFNRGFSGFLVTCGLEHIRAPTATSPQHGRLPVTPARLLAHGEDWEAETPMLFCEGEVTQARYGGEAWRLRRRIEMPIGGTRLRIIDRVTNLAASPQPHAMLYHFNLGWPAIDTGTRVLHGATELVAPIVLPDPSPSPAASCRLVDRLAWAECEVVPVAPGRAARIAFGFDTSTLPYLQTWRDLQPGAGVLAIEPCTSMRRDDGGSDASIQVTPSETRTYTIEVAFGPP